MNDSVMSLKLRPKNLDDLIGQEEVVNEVRQQFASGRIPRVYLLEGESGAGKSSLAYILALLLQGELGRTLTESEWANYDAHSYDIHEINAADYNGVNEMRELINRTYLLPAWESLFRVFILNEAHKLTKQAQEALLVPTEKADHNIWIFTTTSPKDILPTLQRRCVKFKLKPLTKVGMTQLLTRAASAEGITADVPKLVDLLDVAGITSPGIATMALEKVAAGATPEKAVDAATNQLNSRELCRDLLKGEWKNISAGLGTYTSDDVISLRYMLLGYLKKVVINGNGRAGQAAKMISLLTENAPSETPALVPWIGAKLFQAVQVAKK